MPVEELQDLVELRFDRPLEVLGGRPECRADRLTDADKRPRGSAVERLDVNSHGKHHDVAKPVDEALDPALEAEGPAARRPDPALREVEHERIGPLLQPPLQLRSHAQHACRR